MSEEQKKTENFFNRKKYASLDGLTKVRYTPNETPGIRVPDFFIEASPIGIELKGSFLIGDHDGLRDFAELIGKAFTDFYSLRKKIDTSISGH